MSSSFTNKQDMNELARLVHQDRLMNRALGLLPEDIEMQKFTSILDLGCGPGGWILDMAKTHSHIQQAIGIDKSEQMIQCARLLAQAEHVSRATFLQMDMLEPLAFPDDSFDLIYARILFGTVSPENWPGLLAECVRVTRPGGVICLTELEMSVCTSPAAQHLFCEYSQAWYLLKRSFSVDGQSFGITPMLKPLLRQAGCRDVSHRAYAADFSVGEADAEGWMENFTMLVKLSPVTIQAGITTREEKDQVYQQALADYRSGNFYGLLYFLSAWGIVP